MYVIFKILFIITIVSLSLTKDRKDDQANIERFLQDLDDSEWHIAHLKHVEFDGRRDCKGETFADKARRYRKTLRDDGALVMYVSAEPLPFNESEIIEDNCKLDIEDDNSKKTPKNDFTPLTTLKMAEVDDHAVFGDSLMVTKAVNNTVNDTYATDVNATSPMSPGETEATVLNKATTTARPTKSGEAKASTKKDDKSRRGDYMFSSVEYYDEILDFDVSFCPDVVDVIELQVDQLRGYDIECERIVQWHSLHD